MTTEPTRGLPRRSLRVALASTGVVAIILVLTALVIDLVVAGSLIGSVDRRLQSNLATFAQLVDHGPPGANPPRRIGQTDPQVVDVPLSVWVVDGNGDIVLSTPHSPNVPPDLRNVTSPTDVNLEGTAFRVAGAQVSSGWLIVGQSRSVIDHNLGTVILTEVVVVPVLLLLIFGVALVVGRRVARPIEAARQRQLAFTADASHELRTPLAVIEAETALALTKPRKAPEYRAALDRVAGEASRLRAIVDSLLWLARFDAAPAKPTAEHVDLAAAMEVAVDRFRPIAAEQGLTLDTGAPSGPAHIAIPPEWIERLLGVLLDNACRYTPAGGTVRVTVSTVRGRVDIAIDDSGPGVPADQQTLIFNRFHRATGTDSEGSGLGLAIADSIARASEGTLRVDDSDLGGARFSVSWAAISGPTSP